MPSRVLPSIPSSTAGRVSTADLFHLKELKIKGSIGNPGEKEKLGYHSLMSQITTYRDLGYSEERIVAAVINAITPGNTFKKRLEMKRNLTGKIPLSALIRSIRTHYQEKDSDTYENELKDAVQEPGEAASQFADKLMVLRDSALYALKEEGCESEGKSIQKKFLKSFKSGLRNGNIRNELREGLKSEPDDDDLLDMINKAVHQEAERTLKLTQSKTAEVSLVSKEKNDFQRDPPKKQENDVKKRDNLYDKMEEMRINHQNEMGSLRAELCEIKNVFKNGFSNQPPSNVQPPSRVCPPSQSGQSYNNSAVNQSAQSLAPAAQQHQPVPTYVIPQMGGGLSNSRQFSSFQQNGGGLSNNNQQLSSFPQNVGGLPNSQQLSSFAQNNVGSSSNNQQFSSFPQNASGYSTLPSNRPPRRFFGCQACIAQNVPRCTHCLYCGRSGHQISGCPVRESAALRNGVNGVNGANGGGTTATGPLNNNGSAGNC